MTWKLSFLEEKRLLIRTVFVLTSLTLRTERSTQSSIAQEARVSFVAHFVVSAPFITTSKWKWTFEFVESIGGNDELNIHRWKEYNVTLEFRAWLGYFYIIFTFIAWSYCLTSYQFQYVRSVSMVKLGSREVTQSHCAHGFYGAQVQLHMIFLAHNQKSSRLCDQLVVSFEPCLVLKPNRVALTELPGSSVHSNN